MLHRFASIVLLGLLVSLSACATIFTGTHDDVTFHSEPEGAEVFIEGVYAGTTPLTVPVHRTLHETEVTVRMEGYEPIAFLLKQEFNTVAVLNLADVLGWGIDVATGAVSRYDKRGYHVDFERDLVALGLDTLARDAAGRVVVPKPAETVAVLDEAQGLGYVFAAR
ncbi:MAG: PEGA domain-containing protein [Rhodothermaceae bacterium]|nr:PEGA domain-containing protein [Rhodothermaceae bacterium]